MSLTETDESREASRRERRGERWGYNKALTEIEMWVSNDSGMISVKSLQVRIKELREKGCP